MSSSDRIYFRLSLDLLHRTTVSSQVLLCSSLCFLVIPNRLYILLHLLCSLAPSTLGSTTKAFFHLSWLSLHSHPPPTPTITSVTFRTSNLQNLICLAFHSLSSGDQVEKQVGNHRFERKVVLVLGFSDFIFGRSQGMLRDLF